MAGRARPVGALLLTHGCRAATRTTPHAGGDRGGAGARCRCGGSTSRTATCPGRAPPDRAPKLLESLQEQADAFAAERRTFGPSAWLLGGRSMGGRMCSMAVAEGLPAAALVLIAYPLHPPGKPDRLRVEHLPQLDVPCLFVTGTRDPFGTPEELLAATATIAGPVTHHWVEGKAPRPQGRRRPGRPGHPGLAPPSDPAPPSPRHRLRGSSPALPELRTAGRAVRGRW